MKKVKNQKIIKHSKSGKSFYYVSITHLNI